MRKVAREYGIDRRTLGRWVDNGRLHRMASEGGEE